ncbi:MAG: 6-phosphogluconolactonase [Bacteroidota bacterium]|nr:6-phosphogluconolactonase [Bacteroidota bacterium]
MKNNLHIFKTPEELADKFANQFVNWVEAYSGNEFHFAISGGKTPDLLFDFLAERFPNSVLWQKIHFWWVDERMVAPTHPESNFGVVQNLLFSKIAFPEENIHRIKGENTPEVEAFSYSAQIHEKLHSENGWPVFDLIILGMGDDGHTASIFPNQMELLDSEKICEVATHPVSGQKRVTLTGNVINNADKVCFLVTGSNKADRMAEIWGIPEKANLLPAAHIHPESGDLTWYIDEASANLLSR